MVITHHLPDQTAVFQFRPDTPKDGPKYRFLKGQSAAVSVLPTMLERRVPTLVLAEGTKQALAAASHAPADVVVAGIPGISGYRHRTAEGVSEPSPLLEQLITTTGVERVVVIPDADVRRKPEVWSEARRLAQHIKEELGLHVAFAPCPGDGSTGLDDWLGELPQHTRSAKLAALISEAGDLPPRPSPAAAATTTALERPQIRVNKTSTPEIAQHIAKAMSTAKHPVHEDEPLIVQRLIGGKPGPLVSRNKAGIRVWASTEEAALAVTQPVRQGARSVDQLHAYPASAIRLASLSLACSTASIVTDQPALLLDGRVIVTPGYHSDTGVLSAIDPAKWADCTVPEHPTQAQSQEAFDWVLDEVLGDFPLAPAEQARAVAALLTMLTRDLYGPCPIILFAAPTAGTGKGLLRDISLVIGTGSSIQSFIGWSNRHDVETAKTVVAATLMGRRAIGIDDLPHNATLTSRLLHELPTNDGGFELRILGINGAVVVGGFIITVCGNNPSIGGDIPRRILPIRLDVTHGRTIDRGGWRHGDLKSWVSTHRPGIVGHLLTILSHGLQQPKQPGLSTGFGSFEGWAAVVLQSMAQITIDGMPALDLVRQGRTGWLTDHDEEGEDWAPFMASWVSEKPDQWIRATDLHDHLSKIRDLDLPADLLPSADQSPAGRARAWGRALRKRVGTAVDVHGELMRIQIQPDAKRGHRFRVAVEKTDQIAATITPIAHPRPHNKPKGSPAGERTIRPTDAELVNLK